MLFVGIRTSGNTSGTYAFLRWCAALVLVVGALAGGLAQGYTTGPGDTSVTVGGDFQQVRDGRDTFNLNLKFKKPYGLTLLGSSSDVVKFTILMRPFGKELQCKTISGSTVTYSDPTLHGGFYKLDWYDKDSAHAIGGEIPIDITDGISSSEYYKGEPSSPDAAVATPGKRFWDQSCTDSAHMISITKGAVEVVVLHDGQSLGSSQTVSLGNVPLSANQRVQVVRDDRCGEVDAVEWILAVADSSVRPLVEATSGGSVEQYCEGDLSQDPRFRWCLIPNAGGDGDFAKTLTLANNDSRAKFTGAGVSHTSPSTVWNRQTAGTVPSAPQVSVYGDHSGLGKSSAVVTWSEVDDPANSGKKAYGYDVVYHVYGRWWRAISCDLPQTVGDVNRVVCSGGTCFYRLNDLDPNAAYRFSVRAHGRGGASAWAQNATLPVASAVSGLSATRRTNGDVRVSWTTSSSPSPSYHLTYYDGTTNRSQRSLSSSPSTSPFDMAHADLDPHRTYRVGLRQAAPDGSYAGRWSPWRNAGPAAPYSLPAVSGLSAFWNSAYQGRLAVRWDGLPGATGYHVTIGVLAKGGGFTNNLVAMHHTGTWLLVTDRAPGNLQLCPGDRVRIGVRALYEPDGQWNNDGGNTDQPDVYGPWRDTPAGAWANINKKDPPDGGC